MLAHVQRARFAWFRSQSLTLAFAALACTACGSTGSQEDVATTTASSLVSETNDGLAAASWTTIGNGVSYKHYGSGNDVLIAYGGYLAEEVYVQRWADEVVRQKLGARGVSHIYAVQGPNQSAYANQEIGNTHLNAHLKNNGIASAATNIIVAAHSSGTFVSAELFSQMNEGLAGSASEVLGKVTYFALDGGGTAGSILAKLSGAYFVYGCDTSIGRCSENSSSMKSLGSEYAIYGGAVEVLAPNSGCSATASGGLWCLHDTLVTNHPHDPTFYDLGDDYTDFTNGRVVTTSYLNHLPAPAASSDDATDDDAGSDASAD